MRGSLSRQSNPLRKGLLSSIIFLCVLCVTKEKCLRFDPNQKTIAFAYIFYVSAVAYLENLSGKGTKCQKFTGNEIHWERISPSWISLSKFFVLNISKGRLKKFEWALNFSTLHAEGAREKREKPVNIFRIFGWKLQNLFACGAIDTQARKIENFGQKNQFLHS